MSYKSHPVAEFNSWIGHSPDAVHIYVRIEYYGKNNEYQREDLLRTLTTKEAIELNKKELYATRLNKYKKGDKFNGFWTYEDGVKAALKWVKENLPEATFLFEGSWGSGSVQKCLMAPTPAIKKRINVLYKRAEKLGYYNKDANWPEMEKIDAEFEKLIGRPPSE